ncbi:MAG: potassium-transporting ATPase subunit KdpA [Pseudomonadota bacterium]
MTGIGTLQIVLYLFVLIILVKPLGWYIARVYEGKSCGLDIVLGPVERLLYRLCGIKADCEMNWKNYLAALLIFNLLGILLVYGILRLQFFLPYNPQHFPAIPTDLAFNTAASFATNSDWQAYGGESSMSYLTQMLAFTVQNFLSAASGMALLIAFIRGFIRHETSNLGNFWVDLVRSIFYILLPLSIIFAVFLSSQGVIQNLQPYVKADLISPISYQAITTDPGTNNPNGVAIKLTQQTIPMGPVASQVAIKQIGTNGGGFFNANSAHPFENPTPLTNFFEMLFILLIPAALCYTYGQMIGDTHQGWAILVAMLLIIVPMIFLTYDAELAGNPKIRQMGISPVPIVNFSPGGNMEGKETRFGIVNSTLWSVATTASGNGSVNSMLDSYVPVGGLLPLWLIELSEVVFGGVGSGLATMLIFVILTVFVAGLMVGRTPEYLGKKIEPYEMKMASFTMLIMPLVVLISTAVAVVLPAGVNSLGNSGAHGLSEILYTFSSMTNNNGSAFAGINANTPFYNILGGIDILIGRYWIAVPTLAIAGSMARKKRLPSTAGTLPTDSLLFVILLVSVIMIIGALTFFPALALGPIVEQLQLWNIYVS